MAIEVVYYTTEDGPLEEFLNKFGSRSSTHNYKVVSVVFIQNRTHFPSDTNPMRYNERHYQIIFDVTAKNDPGPLTEEENSLIVSGLERLRRDIHQDRMNMNAPEIDQILLKEWIKLGSLQNRFRF